MRPIKCDGEVDEFSRSACHRIVDNQLGEKELFSNGMSIIDLQVAYASSQPFVKYREWKTGFCLYSDWIWGFFTNFYNLSVHVEDDKWKDIPVLTNLIMKDYEEFVIMRKIAAMPFHQFVTTKHLRI
jgi:hypothetical protein